MATLSFPERPAADAQVLLLVAEAAVLLRISRKRCYAMVAAKKLPVVKLGRSVRVPLDALKLWIARNTKNVGTAHEA